MNFPYGIFIYTLIFFVFTTPSIHFPFLPPSQVELLLPPLTLTCFSVDGIKHPDKKRPEEGVLKEVVWEEFVGEGAPSKDLEAGTLALGETIYWLVFHGLLILQSCKIQDHLPRGGGRGQK